MAKNLVTFNDMIDEIEINGFVIMTDKEVENYEHMATSILWPFVFKIGEDELEYSSGEDLLSRMDFIEISNEEAKTIKRLFNDEFGVFVNEVFLAEIIGDEEFDDEFDDDDDDDDYYGDDSKNYDDESDDIY
jgi:hypothetical protein